MILLNTTGNPLKLNFGAGISVVLPCRALVTLTGEQEKALKTARAKNPAVQALFDEGKIETSGKNMEEERSVDAVTSPEAPVELTDDAEKNGRKAKVKKLEPDGTVAV